MLNLVRRDFLKSATIRAACLSTVTGSTFASGSVRRPTVGFIGCGGRSKSLLSDFKDIADIKWACDPDQERLKVFADKSNVSKTTSDLRQLLDDPAVEAVVIATPDHWHAPAAIMACEAGKHVYVEKPCSHNLLEGKLLVEAARRNKVVVQHGTQSRTDPIVVNAIRLIEEGAIGSVLAAKAWNVQRRKNIGIAKPTSPPEGVDYDTWVGPAEFIPYQANRFHYNWHWWHNFGTGDIGNDGAHELDIARWGLGTHGLPHSTFAIGGKYYFDDEQQFPDTATCAFEWSNSDQGTERRQLIFEMRLWSKNYPHNCDTGIEFYGTQGMLFVSKRGKFTLWNDDNKVMEAAHSIEKQHLPASHQLDFLQAIDQGRKPAADIELGHHSTALIHLANIAVRTGRGLKIDPIAEAIVDDREAHGMLSRKYRENGHWSVPAGTTH